MIRLPQPCLVVLAGPGASGKSHWAAEWFPSGPVVSSDALRALVGEGEHDQRAGTDAFAVLDLVVERRLRRRLTTVVDTLGYDPARRRAWVALARRFGVPAVAVVFDAGAAECRARNRARAQPVPARVLADQLRRWPEVRASLSDDGFDTIHPAGPVAAVHPELVGAPESARRQQEHPMPLRFGLQIANFTWPGGPPAIGPGLADAARAAEGAGFTGLWVMDHMVQIPVVGRHWDDMLDGWTALSFLAAHTERATLGTLVTGVTYRNVAHLGKIVATLDVLSGGRAVCGLGAAWYEREHQAYGWRFPPLRERFALLEDALQLLPVLWGPGTPAFEGKVVSVPEAICYPRPLQERVPILVGGSGEKRTLRLVARYADACNLVGDAPMVRHKVEVLRAHCATEGRDPAEVEVTHLGSCIVTGDGDSGPPAVPARTVVGPVADQVGRFRDLAEAGVQTAIVRFPDPGDGSGLAERVERFVPVMDAFR